MKSSIFFIFQNMFSAFLAFLLKCIMVSFCKILLLSVYTLLLNNNIYAEILKFKNAPFYFALFYKYKNKYKYL